MQGRANPQRQRGSLTTVMGPTKDRELVTYSLSTLVTVSESYGPSCHSPDLMAYRRHSQTHSSRQMPASRCQGRVLRAMAFDSASPRQPGEGTITYPPSRPPPPPVRTLNANLSLCGSRDATDAHRVVRDVEFELCDRICSSNVHRSSLFPSSIAVRCLGKS